MLTASVANCPKCSEVVYWDSENKDYVCLNCGERWQYEDLETGED